MKYSRFVVLAIAFLAQALVACGDGVQSNEGMHSEVGPMKGGTPGVGGVAHAGGMSIVGSGGAEGGGALAAGGSGGAGAMLAVGGTNSVGGSVLLGGGPSTKNGDGMDDNPTAEQAAQNMGRGFNLGQMFESTQHSRTLEAASLKIDAYYSRGFRNVRIPITWTEPVAGDLLVHDALVGNVNREHPRLRAIADVIDYALQLPGLYVVINTHHEEGLKTEARATVLQRLWQDISDIFADRAHRLVFEIMNEPHKADSSAMAATDVRLATGLAYDKIRAVDPKRIVLIGGNQWFAAEEVPKVWTNLDEVGGGTDPYVMATFHHYNPWTFCGDNQGSYDDAWTENHLTSPMATMQDWAATIGGGMPIYIGEWGVGWQSVYSVMTCNNVRAWYTAMNEEALARGMSTAVWDDGGWFRVFDHDTGEYDNNLIECMQGACQWEGQERFNSGCL